MAPVALRQIRKSFGAVEVIHDVDVDITDGEFVILFIYGWNQYLWPLLITTRDDMQTIVIGIKKMIVTSDALTEWQLVMATAMLAMLPPVMVVVLMQRLFVRGLVETEK